MQWAVEKEKENQKEKENRKEKENQKEKEKNDFDILENDLLANFHH